MVMQKMLNIETTCPLCRKKTTIRVGAEEYQKWKAGGHIQSAFPGLTDDEREALLSGTCYECWNKMWGEGFADVPHDDV
jgi:hypothetical protein